MIIVGLGIVLRKREFIAPTEFRIRNITRLTRVQSEMILVWSMSIRKVVRRLLFQKHCR